MILSTEQKENISREFNYSASRSSGPGGQNVNKVNTRVELRFNIQTSEFLNEQQKQILQSKLKNRINTDGELVLNSGSERSQWRNKSKVTEKFYQLLEKALTPTKKRVKTKPTATSRLKRMENKKKTAQKKQLRKPPSL